jgi:hypothetical protein
MGMEVKGEDSIPAPLMVAACSHMISIIMIIITTTNINLPIITTTIIITHSSGVPV